MEEKQITYSFPIRSVLEDDYLVSNFWKCLYTSAEESLQYWVILPNHVKPTKVTPIEISNVNLVNIGQYISIDDSPYLEIEVVTEYCEYEINASDWLWKKLAIIGEAVLDFREITGESTGKYLDVLTIKKTPGGEEIISRFTTIKDHDKNKNGANLFCIKATCFSKDYENLAGNIFHIVTNWDLIYKSDWQMAENILPFEYDFTEAIRFYIPVSWEIKYETKNTNTFSRFVFAHPIGSFNRGVINAFFYSIKETVNVATIYEKSFNRMSKLTTDLTELTKIRSDNPAIKELWTLNGTIEYKSENYAACLFIYIIKTLNGWYYFESVGPKPNLQNYYFEINIRCIEIILQSFNNLNLDTVKEDDHIPPETVSPSVNKTLKNNWLIDQ